MIAMMKGKSTLSSVFRYIKMDLPLLRKVTGESEVDPTSYRNFSTSISLSKFQQVFSKLITSLLPPPSYSDHSLKWPTHLTGPLGHFGEVKKLTYVAQCKKGKHKGGPFCAEGAKNRKP